MTAAELKHALQQYYDDPDIGVTVYAVLRGREDNVPAKLDIENDAQEALKKLFFQSLRATISDNDDLTLLNLSEADERGGVIYVYDLEIPIGLASMKQVIEGDDAETLDLNSESVESIKALIVEIGNNVGQLVLYKTMTPVNIFGRGSFFLRKSATRLEELDDEFLRITPNFQFLLIEDKLLVVDLPALERTFGFHDVVKREAERSVRAIEKLALVENPESLQELADDVTSARKLARVAKSSPVLEAGIANDDIIRFCQTYPGLTGKIRINDAGDKIVLSTKASRKLFVKLLMDDFLTSELTKFHYASIAKESVDPAQGDAA